MEGFKTRLIGKPFNPIPVDIVVLFRTQERAIKSQTDCFCLESCSTFSVSILECEPADPARYTIQPFPLGASAIYISWPALLLN